MDVDVMEYNRRIMEAIHESLGVPAMLVEKGLGKTVVAESELITMEIY